MILTKQGRNIKQMEVTPNIMFLNGLQHGSHVKFWWGIKCLKLHVYILMFKVIIQTEVVKYVFNLVHINERRH